MRLPVKNRGMGKLEQNYMGISSSSLLACAYISMSFHTRRRHYTAVTITFVHQAAEKLSIVLSLCFNLAVGPTYVAFAVFSNISLLE